MSSYRYRVFGTARKASRRRHPRRDAMPQLRRTVLRTAGGHPAAYRGRGRHLIAARLRPTASVGTEKFAYKDPLMARSAPTRRAAGAERPVGLAGDERGPENRYVFSAAQRSTMRGQPEARAWRIFSPGCTTHCARAPGRAKALHLLGLHRGCGIATSASVSTLMCSPEASTACARRRRPLARGKKKPRPRPTWIELSR